MRILFLNPPAENVLPEYPDETGQSYIDTDDFGLFPPLGMLYVLSYLEKKTTGHQLFFKDCVAEKISHEALSKVVEEIRPDIVGITSFTVALVDVCKAARTVRSAAPDAHICLGGHHPISFPFEAAGLKEFDSIVVGEGEVPFTELVNALEKKGDITQIRGVYTGASIGKWAGKDFKDRRFLWNVKVEPAYIKDLDELPIPNRSYIKHINYRSTVGKTPRLATIITSRGCPYRCIFCNVPYKEYRSRSVGNVLDEVEVCLKMGYKEFHFYDDLFNITPEKVIGFCDEVKKRNLKFIWDFRGRVNTATRESLERAKDAGCRMISFGVETGSNEGLKMLNKNTTVEKVREVFWWCRQLKIKTIADFMIGLPFEKTREDVLKNIDFLIGLDPDYAQVAVLCLYPYTDIYDQALRKGLLKDGKWEKFSLNPAAGCRIDHWTEFLSTKELVKLQKMAYKKYYLRLPYVIRAIVNTESLYEFSTKARAALKLIS